MKQLLLAVPMVLAASAGAAQDVLFRSGEHEDFTRLVATLPSAETDWTVSRDGRFYTIKIEGDAVNLRTSTIFDKIPRDRLANFVANDVAGELELELACACRVVSIPYDGRYVIFDIRDDLPPAQNDDMPQVPLSFGEAVAVDKPQRQFRFSSIEASKPTPTPVEMAEIKPTEDYSDLLALDNFVERKAQVQVLRGDLIKQVDRAADQNLLHAQTQPAGNGLVGDPVKMAESPMPPMNGSDHVPPQAAIGLEGQDLNIVAYNVIDEVGRDIAALLSGQVATGMCLPDTAVNLADWSGEGTFVQELGRLRQDVVGEFDRTNEGALLEMAQLYVHYTFGAEALQILELLPKTGENSILSAMAYIMDGHEPPASNAAFANQGHCSGNATLWAALSGETLVGDSAIKGALDALQKMPRHLREYLGPKLSNRLVAQGQTEAATLVLNGIERTSLKPDVNYDFAEATLNAELGNTEEATEALTEIATQNSDIATTAVIDLINTHVKQGVPPSAETVSLVGALAVEHKTGAMGPELRRAHALARMLEHEFGPAFKIIKDIETRDGAKAAADVRTQLVLAILEHADDFEVISWSIQERLAAPGRISSDTALKLAQKTFEMGFLGETKRLMQAAQTDIPSDEKRVLNARLALAEALPKRAEAELMGMETPLADRLRARAKAMAGDHAGAARLLAKLGERGAAEAEAWLDGDLASLTASENEILRRASTHLLPPEDTAELDAATDRVTHGMLARNRALLEGAEESRGVLGELLNLHSLSEPSS
ncbi:hypothetical protein [Shimia sagamensis]|uniref:HEAT repeat domain-containing protein n=1 Tax=Shimia sagamensis TaxID=1566352 RepID=A0ABY1NF69_9RHOB|nr:hypothetical protein [Shimia sagamensis]SMP07557.1 hypothetical protein SAMN06265373_101783 [Shimia sagamensis]